MEGKMIFSIPSGVAFKLISDGRLYGLYNMDIQTNSNGVGCIYCRQIIEKNCYYCEDDNIFMHKDCLVKNHRITKNITVAAAIMNERTEHEDKCVDVRFVDDYLNQTGGNYGK